MIRAPFLTVAAVAMLVTPRLASPLVLQTEHVLAPDTIVVQSGSHTLHGLLYRPPGRRPFPTILFVHGGWNAQGPHAEHDREVFERQAAALGPVFARHGYLFLFLYRLGAGLSADGAPHNGDLLDKALATHGLDARNQLQLRLMHGSEMNDELSGMAYLRALRDVDAQRVAVVGHSFGGSMVLWMAEHDSTIRAVVDFAGAAKSWTMSPPLRAQLLDAVDHIKAPVLIIHAANDYSVSPAIVLGSEMTKNGKSHRVRIYPPIGNTTNDGHNLIYLRVSAWEPDVFAFLNESMR